MDVATEIRSLILSGDLVPNQRLIESDLSEQFAASRASVRQALGELAVEGLVERVQNRGARVRVIEFEEAIEIAEVRRALESLCARKAAELVTDEQIAALNTIGGDMEDAVHRGDVARYSAGNRELHALIHRISGQRTALAVIERLRGQSVRQQYRLAVKPGRAGVSVAEHVAIIRAVSDRDPDAAERAMSAHLDSVIRAMRDVDSETRTP